MKDADKVLAKKRVSSMRSAEKVISKLGLRHPHQWPKESAEAWKTLGTIEPLRHRLIHGFKSMNPSVIQAATQVTIRLVSHHNWLSSVPIEGHLVGSLIDPKRSSLKSHSRSIQELADRLNVDLEKGNNSLPSLTDLENMLKHFEAIA